MMLQRELCKKESQNKMHNPRWNLEKKSFSFVIHFATKIKSSQPKATFYADL